MLEYNENIYKKVGNAGVAGIVVGIILIIVAIAIGIISIVFGAKALHAKNHLIG